MASRLRVSVVPLVVLVVMVPTSEPEESATPQPEDPSCAAAEPPRASTSIVFCTNVYTFFTEPKTMVGKRDDCIWLESISCAPYEAMTTGVPVFEGEVASGINGKDCGSSSLVVLLEIARKAKSYSPVPLGFTFVRISAFALIHSGGM